MSSAVDEFESAFQSCITALTSPTTNYTHDSEEVKTSADQTVQRFLDSAKAMESFFLQKRLYLSVHRPEQLIREEIDDIKVEIQRKDAVIAKFQEKLQLWQAMLSDQQPQTPVAGQITPAHPLANQNPHAALQQQQLQQTHGPPAMAIRGVNPQIMSQSGHPPPHILQQQQLSSQMGPQLGPQMSPAGGRMQNPHILSPRTQMIQPSYGPNVSSGQYHYAPSGQMMQQHSPSVMPQQSQHPQPQSMQQHAQQQQSPLAFLERTTSNIGLSDPNRK